MSTIEKAIEVYGKDMQLNVAVEEFSELIKEICKHKRGADNRDNIIEEVADCYIMMEQIKMIFEITESEMNVAMYEKLMCLERAELDIKAIQADTVRKMQERLTEKAYSVPTVYNAHFGRMIDQIAKEMLNERPADD